jgi:hypothetical protein
MSDHGTDNVGQVGQESSSDRETDANKT